MTEAEKILKKYNPFWKNNDCLGRGDYGFMISRKIYQESRTITDGSEIKTYEIDISDGSIMRKYSYHAYVDKSAENQIRETINEAR